MNTIFKAIFGFAVLGLCLPLYAAQNTPASVAGQAFNDMLHSYFPLSPKQIHRFKNRAALQAQANAAPPGPSPSKGTSGTILVSLKPGSIMPAVRIGRGMISSLVFTDAAGKVWPIESYSIGDPTAFNIHWDKKSGVLMVQGQKLYAQTNIGVMLKGLNIPVMLTFLVGQKEYDYLDYIRVQAYQSPGEGSATAATSQAPNYLIRLLDGIPPGGSQALKVSGGGNSEMWSYDGVYLLKTHATLLSPAWDSKFVGTGPAPMHVYKLPATPYILLSNAGKIERLTVSEGNA